jgi:hypothetical protein
MRALIPRGRRLLFAGLVAVTILTVTAATLATSGGEPVVTGELVETYCWARVRVTGPAHAACGIECAKRGIPLAVVDAATRKAYVLLPGRDKTAIPPELVAAMGTKVSIRGEVIARAGAQFVTVSSWEKAR